MDTWETHLCLWSPGLTPDSYLLPGAEPAGFLIPGSPPCLGVVSASPLPLPGLHHCYFLGVCFWVMDGTRCWSQTFLHVYTCYITDYTHLQVCLELHTAFHDLAPIFFLILLQYLPHKEPSLKPELIVYWYFMPWALTYVTCPRPCLPLSHPIPAFVELNFVYSESFSSIFTLSMKRPLTLLNHIHICEPNRT